MNIVWGIDMDGVSIDGFLSLLDCPRIIVFLFCHDGLQSRFSSTDQFSDTIKKLRKHSIPLIDY